MKKIKNSKRPYKVEFVIKNLIGELHITSQSDIQNQPRKEVYSELNNERSSLGGSRFHESVQGLSAEKKKGELNAIVESLRVNNNLLQIALDYMLNCKKNHSQQSETSQAKDLECFLGQVHSFQVLVSQQVLPLLEKIQNNKI